MRKWLLLFVLGLGNLGFAQDFHFSQFEALKLTRHALPLENQGEAVIAYRAQWTGISSFRNMLAAYHHQVSDFSLGGKLIQNDAGEKSLKTTQLLLDLNYKKILNHSEDFIAFGASAGFIQQRFRPESFKFDLQYVEGEGFDESLENGENFRLNNQLIPVVHAGLYGRTYLDNFSLSFGLSLNNINKPEAGFNKDAPVYFSHAFSSFVEMKTQLKDAVYLDAYLRYDQFNFFEWMLGSRIKYQFNDDLLLNFGLAHRLNNSVVFEIGTEFQQFIFMLSYDFLYGNISAINGQIGSFELSARYLIGE